MSNIFGPYFIRQEFSEKCKMGEKNGYCISLVYTLFVHKKH